MTPLRVTMAANLTIQDPGDRLDAFRALARWRSSEGYRKRVVRLSRWDPDRGLLTLPRGLWPLPDSLGPYTLTDERLLLAPVSFRWRGPALAPEQERVARGVHRNGEGLLVASGGFGKTVVGQRLVAAWRQPCLWIVDTADLARQALDRARECFGLPASAFGEVRDGAVNPGTHFTVGLRQTLRHVRDPGFYRRFGAVIYDESDLAAANTAWRLLCRFPGRYRIGLTATPERADKLHPVVFAVVGRSIVRVTKEQAIAAGRFVDPVVRLIPTGRVYHWRGSWPELQRRRADDGERNWLIARMAALEVRRGHNALLLVQLLSQAASLTAMLDSLGVHVRDLTGEVPPDVRDHRLAVARRGGGVALVATKLLNRGVDLPVMDRLFLCDGYRSAPTVEQQTYRATRTADGKRDAVIYDFQDFGAQFERQQRARVRHYRKLGYRVEEMPDIPRRATSGRISGGA